MNRHTFAALLALLALSAACARQGYPSGGPRDTRPPQILSVQPANRTLHFSGNSFYIAFDEYVTVKDADNNILVSPPLKHKPDYVQKGRGLQVRLKDTLLDNATYLFQFQGAIVDFNEGNALQNFEYVFSTGASIDTMCLSGRVIDALTLKPLTEPVAVVAHPAAQFADDSAAARLQPRYLTRCDKDGNFTFNHIQPGQYRVLAIQDADKNLRLGNDEAAAWQDSLATAVPMPRADTAQAADTARRTRDTVRPLLYRLSAPDTRVQRVTKAEFLHRGRARVTTLMPLSRQYTLTPLMTGWNQAGRQYIDSRLNATGDTLDIWTLNERCDSIVLELSDPSLRDTLSLLFREKKKRATPAHHEQHTLAVKSAAGSQHPYFDTLWLTLDNPAEIVADEPDSAVRVLSLPDSAAARCAIRWDTARHGCRHGLRAYIDFTPAPGTKYQFALRAHTFRDIYGQENDSLLFSIETTRPEQYGNITLHVQRPQGYDGSVLIQMVSEKDELLRQLPLDGTDITFAHLKAGKYRFRAILDSDANGTWTTGSYWQKRQPERAIYLPKTLELRENWDMEEQFILNE